MSNKKKERLKMEVLTRDNFMCQHCGKKYTKDKFDVHHKKPRSQGGSNDLDNLASLCRKCHRLFHKIYGVGYSMQTFNNWIKKGGI